MSNFWDSIKPATRVPVAVQVDLSADQKNLALKWDDGLQTQVTARRLRQNCPCAECVEEWSGKRTFDPEKIPLETKIIEIEPVGNYALTFTFGDLHRVGIFNWKHLRELSG
ncbi:MAG: hypothetical protein H6Q89_49 [Myxococcaceae bacterium]|nr:hypothetical protein [Myxococcaceae bacterium]